MATPPRVGFEDRSPGMGHFRFFATICFWMLPCQIALCDAGTPVRWDVVSTVFEERCINCHSRLGAAKALRLDSYEGTLAGSENGAVVLSGNASDSELIRRVRGERVPRMPFLSTPMPDEEINLIVRWIDGGLPR